MAKKLDIRKDLSNRKFKRTNFFFYFIYRTVMKIVGRKYNVKYEIVDDVNKCKGPCFVIFNHLSRIDHMYVMEACYPKRVNMLAGYSEFFRSHLHFAFKMNNVLPKKQYINDFLGTKAMMSIIKKGGSVTFAPEGLATNDGTPKPIVPHTGGLLKKFGIPVYFCELRGQYLQNTKVCLDERYGETYCRLSLLFSPEDLKNMTSDEIDDKINDAFHHDEYAWQKEKRIKWDMRGRPAYHLHHLLYRCPKCGKELCMDSNDTTIFCKECGNGATVDDYYDLIPLNDECVIPSLTSDWVNSERIAIIKKIREDENYSYVEKAKIGRLPNDHYLKDLKTSEIVASGTFTVDHKGVTFKGEDNSNYDFFLDYNKIYTVVTELDSSYFNFYVDGEYTDVFPENPSSIFISMLIEEMHRLHVNYYKNFKWNDYMYKE